MLAPLLEVAVGVEAGAGRRQQDDLARLRVGRRRVDGAGAGHRSGASATPAVRRRLEVAGQPLGRLADQVASRGSARRPAPPVPSKSPPFSDPPRIARTPPSNDRSAAAAAATLVAFESLT